MTKSLKVLSNAISMLSWCNLIFPAKKMAGPSAQRGSKGYVEEWFVPELVTAMSLASGVTDGGSVFLAGSSGGFLLVGSWRLLPCEEGRECTSPSGPAARVSTDDEYIASCFTLPTDLAMSSSSWSSRVSGRDAASSSSSFTSTEEEAAEMLEAPDGSCDGSNNLVGSAKDSERPPSSVQNDKKNSELAFSIQSSRRSKHLGLIKHSFHFKICLGF